MRRFILLLALSAAAGLFGQEHDGGVKKEDSAISETESAHDPLMKWRILNFAVLAAGIGYLIVKTVPAYFRSRTEEIQRSLVEAQEAKAAAEARASEIERKMAALGAEIEKLRADSREEMAHESTRTKAETERLVAKIQAQAENDIASASKHARAELKTYAAQLALQIAEQQIRSRMTPQTQASLVDSFVRDLDEKHLATNRRTN